MLLRAVANLSSYTTLCYRTDEQGGAKLELLQTNLTLALKQGDLLPLDTCLRQDSLRLSAL